MDWRGTLPLLIAELSLLTRPDSRALRPDSRALPLFEMEIHPSLLDVPEDVLLRTVNMLGNVTDIVNLRETCTDLRALLGANAFKLMMKLRWGAVTDDNVSLETAMKSFAASNSPRVCADHIKGPWTEDKRYWSRERLDGTRGAHRALELRHVWWLALEATFKVYQASFVPCETMSQMLYWYTRPPLTRVWQCAECGQGKIQPGLEVLKRHCRHPGDGCDHRAACRESGVRSGNNSAGHTWQWQRVGGRADMRRDRRRRHHDRGGQAREHRVHYQTQARHRLPAACQGGVRDMLSSGVAGWPFIPPAYLMSYCVFDTHQVMCISLSMYDHPFYSFTSVPLACGSLPRDCVSLYRSGPQRSPVLTCHPDWVLRIRPLSCCTVG